MQLRIILSTLRFKRLNIAQEATDFHYIMMTEKEQYSWERCDDAGDDDDAGNVDAGAGGDDANALVVSCGEHNGTKSDSCDNDENDEDHGYHDNHRDDDDDGNFETICCALKDALQTQCSGTFGRAGFLGM